MQIFLRRIDQLVLVSKMCYVGLMALAPYEAIRTNDIPAWWVIGVSATGFMLLMIFQRRGSLEKWYLDDRNSYHKIIQ